MKAKSIFFSLVIFIVLGCSSIGVSKETELSHPLTARFLMMTFPKSGTHLFRKLFHIIGHELNHPEANDYTWDHFFSNHKECWPKGINPFFALMSKSKSPILVIRDLRDVAISCAYWHTKMVNETGNRGYLSYIPLQVLNEWNALSMEEKVTKYIAGDFYPQYKTFAAFIDDHLKNMEAFLSVIKTPLIIRYEDIVGPNGGGTLESQVDSIYKIAEAIGVHLTCQEVEYICENLFGIRKEDESMGYMLTYRKGGIGNWKDLLSPDQIALVKKRFNWFLIKYGYEVDDQW